MNPRFISPSVLLAAVLASSAFSACASIQREYPAMTHRVTVIERYNENIVEPGSTKLTVRQMLGTPLRRLADDVWVYDRFDALRNNGGADDGCHAVIIAFDRNRVADICLVNPNAEKAIILALNSMPGKDAVLLAAK